MKTLDKEWWSKAQRARDQLVAQLLGNPHISMIDIGMDPEGVSSTPVLRIHLRGVAPPLLNLPNQIDDIPIRVIRGDYELQNHE